MTSTVSIDEVRVGMYIHLDLAWARHPFALSSFRVSSEEQLQALRQLGLTRIRWQPERSRLDGHGAPAAPTSADHATEGHDVPTDRATADRRAALLTQREGLSLVTRQYAEACKALRDISRTARQQPLLARDSATAVAGALVDKMLISGDMCLRLLNTNAGDHAAAHGMNVAVIALLMGRGAGLSETEMLDLGVGAMLHDLGKLDLPARVRHVDDGFTAADTALYRDHVAHGVALGQRMALTPGALAILAQHHEHADGSGFPSRMRSDAIDLGARIVTLVDQYDNLCNPARAGSAMTPHEALSLLFARCRHRFDAALLNGFIRMMGVYPLGSIVQLTDDRHAMVVGVNSARPLKPRVLVHDPAVPLDEALHLDLQSQPDLGIRRSLSVSRLPPDAKAYLAPQRRVAYFFDHVPVPPAKDDSR